MGNTRILLAEDETITRMDLREMLENLGYSVIGEAGDGIAAVNMAVHSVAILFCGFGH